MQDWTELQKIGFRVLSRVPARAILDFAKVMQRDHGTTRLNDVNLTDDDRESIIAKLVELELSHCGRHPSIQGNEHV